MSQLLPLAGSAVKHPWWLVGKPRCAARRAARRRRWGAADRRWRRGGREAIKAFALNMLRSGEVGRFFIREVASTPGCLGLTVKVSDQELVNYLLKPHRGEVTIRGTKEAFPDIPALINFYCAMKRASMPVKLVSGVGATGGGGGSAAAAKLDVGAMLASTPAAAPQQPPRGRAPASGVPDDFFAPASEPAKQHNPPSSDARSTAPSQGGTDPLYLEAKRAMLIEQRKRMALEREKRELQARLEAATSPVPSSAAAERASPSADSSISQMAARRAARPKPKAATGMRMLPIEEDPSAMWQKISASKASHRDKLAAAKAQLEYLRQQEDAVQRRLKAAMGRVRDPTRKFSDNATVFDDNFENGTVVDDNGEVFGFGAQEEEEVFGFGAE